MNITLYVSKGCSACDNVLTKLTAIKNQDETISLKILDILAYPPPFPVIVPAIFIDDILISIGDSEEERLKSIIYKYAS